MSTPAWPKIEAALPQIAEWLGNGLSETQAAANVGVDGKTWRKYKEEKPEFAELIRRARVPVIIELRNALYRRAIGGKRTVVKTSRKRNADGTESTYMEKFETDDPPNVAAIHLMLKNLDKDNWSNDPVAQEIARSKSGLDAAAAAQEAQQLTEEQLQLYIERAEAAEDFLRKETPHPRKAPAPPEAPTPPRNDTAPPKKQPRKKKKP